MLASQVYYLADRISLKINGKELFTQSLNIKESLAVKKMLLK